jgi:hypothetical protein
MQESIIMQLHCDFRLKASPTTLAFPGASVPPGHSP